MRAVQSFSDHTQALVSGDQVVVAALKNLYKNDRILARSVERLDANSCAVSFVFPAYDKTIEDMGHVSVVQINEAILEAIFCALYLRVSEETLHPDASGDWYLSSMLEWIAFSQNVTYRKMICDGQNSSIIVSGLSLGEKKIRKQFLSLTGELSGYVSGDFEWLLPITSAPH